MKLTEQQTAEIEKKIEETRTRLNQFLDQANREIAFLEGKIAQLESLLELEPQEEPGQTETQE